MNPSSQEAQAGGADQPGQHSEFEANLGLNCHKLKKGGGKWLRNVAQW
jgi:hypothetical protein